MALEYMRPCLACLRCLDFAGVFDRAIGLRYLVCPAASCIEPRIFVDARITPFDLLRTPNTVKIFRRTGRTGRTLHMLLSGPEMLRPQPLDVPLRHAEFLGHHPGSPALIQMSDGASDGLVSQFWLHLLAGSM